MNNTDTSNADNLIEIAQSRFYRAVGVFGLVLFLGGLALLRTDLEVIATGTVARENEFAVFAPSSGLVESVNFDEGDMVKEGDVVLSLDRSGIYLQLLAKRRELAELEYRLGANKLAQKEFEVRPSSVEVMVSRDKSRLLSEISDIQEDLVQRWEELERNRDIRTIELQQERIDQLRLGLEQLDAKVRAQWLEAGVQDIDREKLVLEQQRLERDVRLVSEEVELLQAENERLSVRSPITGFLTRLDVLYPGLVARQGQHLFTVADPESPYIVEALVPERNVDLIKPGELARMESEVFNSTFEGYIYGTVTRVAPDSQSRNLEAEAPSLFEVEIRVDETPLPLVMGSRLKTYIVLGNRSIWELLLDRRGHASRLRGSQEDAS